MSNTNTSTTNASKASFEVGKVVRVFETKGCRNLTSGISSSERKGGEYADIEPSEDLKVIKKLGSTKALVERTAEGVEGLVISMHLNHINAQSSYYAARSLKSQGQKSLAQRAAEAKANAEKLALEAKKLEEELALAEMEAEEAAKTVEANDEARAEAEALFSEAQAG